MILYPCCRCCGTDDPEWAEHTYFVRTCSTPDAHRDPCIMCGQRTPK